jgi:hypothetical protein
MTGVEPPLLELRLVPRHLRLYQLEVERTVLAKRGKLAVTPDADIDTEVDTNMKALRLAESMALVLKLVVD